MLTAEELIARREWLGASDLAAVLNLNPRESGADVFLEKVGLAPSQSSKSDAADVGVILENKVLDMAEEQLGELVRPSDADRLQFAVEGTPIRASLDAMVKGTREPCEAKTSGLFGRLDSEWGLESTDEIPANYIVQVHCQIMGAGDEVRRGFVAALLGGHGFKIFTIERNDDICEAIRRESIKFWKLVTDAKTAIAGGMDVAEVIRKYVPDSVPSLEVLKRVARTPEKVIEFGDEQLALVEEWQTAAKANTEAGKRAESAKARVILALGDAEAARAGAHGAVTYMESQRAGYTVAASTVRTLRVRKNGI